LNRREPSAVLETHQPSYLKDWLKAKQAKIVDLAQSAAGADFRLRHPGLPRLFPGFGASRTRLAATGEHLYRAEGQLGTSRIRVGGDLAIRALAAASACCALAGLVEQASQPGSQSGTKCADGLTAPSQRAPQANGGRDRADQLRQGPGHAVPLPRQQNPQSAPDPAPAPGSALMWPCGARILDLAQPACQAGIIAE
jgi:hypothetical protein